MNGIYLTLDNAVALAEDAELLLNHNRVARALALSIIGIEEMGKLRLYASLRNYVDQGMAHLWWKHFRSHDLKFFLQSLFYFGVVPNDELRDSLSGKAAGLAPSIKNQALYTDYTARGGGFSSPLLLPVADARPLAGVFLKMIANGLPLARRLTERVTPEYIALGEERIDELWEESVRTGRPMAELEPEAMRFVQPWW